MVFSRIIVGLLIFEVTSAGIFALKRAFQLSAMCAPLILATILFKIIMDAAYHHSSQVIPLQLLTQKFGSHHLQYAAEQAAQQNGAPSPSVIEEQTHQPPSKRRTVLDEDDYEAEPVEQTDFREPPMTLFDGILNTGMKKFGHPAIAGVLPQLWLPVKGGYQQQQLERRRSRYIKPSQSTTSLRGAKRASSRMLNQNGVSDETTQGVVQTEYQEEPQAMDADEMSGLLSNGDTAIQVDDGAATSENTHGDESDYDTEEDGINATYYHHPERRRSRSDALGTTPS